MGLMELSSTFSPTRVALQSTKTPHFFPIQLFLSRRLQSPRTVVCNLCDTESAARRAMVAWESFISESGLKKKESECSSFSVACSHVRLIPIPTSTLPPTGRNGQRTDPKGAILSNNSTEHTWWMIRFTRSDSPKKEAKIVVLVAIALDASKPINASTQRTQPLHNDGETSTTKEWDP